MIEFHPKPHQEYILGFLQQSIQKFLQWLLYSSLIRCIQEFLLGFRLLSFFFPGVAFKIPQKFYYELLLGSLWELFLGFLQDLLSVFLKTFVPRISSEIPPGFLRRIQPGIPYVFLQQEWFLGAPPKILLAFFCRVCSEVSSGILSRVLSRIIPETPYGIFSEISRNSRSSFRNFCKS